MSVPNKGERCWLRDWRQYRYTEITHRTFDMLQQSEIYVIAKYPHSAKVSFKPDANEGWLIDNKSIMNQTEYYRWRKANAWRKNDGVSCE